uniref:Integrase catalytic domain-containing protein n=2 Tax=Lygus hesperus TaxID=30085 RepID=A0A0K8S8Z1_LYGHE
MGILRAGGRLFNANLPFNHKHPVLLPPESHLSNLIVDHFHRIYLHPGPSLLQALVQLEYWIPSARRLIRQRIFNCQRCYRLKAKSFIPKMADLPSYRVRAERAFKRTGLDFAGPFLMKESGRRKALLSKVYLCIFVCMTTKAIHLEVVTSLTADAFLATLDRFVSLRGLPSDLYSDCGSNFVSAAGKLKEWYKWYVSENTQEELAERLTPLQIKWHFNPPRAPHFGGIWEAGVKSAKSLMLRTVGDAVLTYEEFATLFAKIGAVLNSRPICPLSNDPSECEYLSPGHFLIGEALLAVPEPTLLDVTLNRLDRWQLVKRMTQFFWDRWHREYLSTLQSRVKWNENTPNLQVGDLVFLKDDNSPVLQWPRGRVVEVHPGQDGVVRVASVQTSTSTFSRPVAKLVPLFPENVANSSPAENPWNGWPQEQEH